MAALEFAPQSPLPATPDVADALHSLGERLTGRLILPESDDYEAARQIHNLRFDRRPIAIVRVAGAEDVIRAVAFARTSGLPLAVRSGGHSVAGHSIAEGGLVIDLSDMRRLQIDPERRTAWAEPGLTAGEYTAAAAAHGLATPFGDAGSVGLGGITLGGGVGYLVRKHGLTIDSLLAVEIVTADGRLVVASEDEHPDLFWAVRGGGGNFGIATAFKYRLHEVGMVVGGALMLPPTPQVISRFAEVAAAAPDELSTISMVMRIPPLPMIPEAAHGQLTFMVLLVYAGDPADAEAALAPIRALAQPMADLLGPMPYAAMYELGKEAEQPVPSTIRSTYLERVDESLAAAMVDAIANAPSPAAMAQLRVLGGAMARVPNDATAFANRDDRFLLSVVTPFVGPAAPEAHVAWTEALWSVMRPLSTGVYANFLEDEGDDRIRAAFPNGAYQRLVEVKRTWDPGNLFRLNQNIRPA